MEMDFSENFLDETPELVDYKVLSVRKRKFGEISLDDPFFDSLKEDYPGFEGWFKKKSEDDAYVTTEEGKILSFLYLKIENPDEDYSQMTPPLPPKRRLKVGTLKVSDPGFRLGERFLKIIFDNALKNKVEGIYVTIYDKRPEQKRLILLLEEWGFSYWGKKNGDENVYARDLEPPREINISQLKKSYPYISGKRDAFIVPIHQKYHTELFPDSILRTESPEEFIDNSPHRNCIGKAYISWAREPHPKVGDILVFYRTGGRYESVITTIGVVQELRYDFRDEKEFISYCRKISVFSEDELRDAWRHYHWKKPFVVRFLYVYSFPHRINMEKLIELGILQGVGDAPRGFRSITKDQLKTIIRETKSDDSFIIY